MARFLKDFTQCLIGKKYIYHVFLSWKTTIDKLGIVQSLQHCATVKRTRR